MAGAVELATAYIALVPSLKGASQKISEQLTPAAGSAGAEGGSSLGAALMGGLKKFALPIAGVVAAFSVGKLVKDSTEQFESYAGAVKGFGRLAGGTVEQFSGLRGAMQLSGVDVNNATGAITIFSKNLGKAGQDTTKTAAMTKLLGESFKDAHGNIKPMSELLPGLSDKFKSMPDGAAKTALATQLFGRAGAQMLPFLNQGAAGIADLTKQAGKMGLVLDDTSMRIFGDAKKSAREYTTSIQGLKIQLGQSLTPALDAVHNIFRSFMIPIIQAGTQAFVKAREPILHFAEGVQAMADRVRAGMTGIITLLTTGQFTGGLRKALGIEEDSKVVDVVLKIRDGIINAFHGIKSAATGVNLGAIFAAIGPVFSQIGPVIMGILPSIMTLMQAFSPLGIMLKSLTPVLPLLAGAAGMLAGALTNALSAVLKSLAPIIVGVVSGIASAVTWFMSLHGGAQALAAGITALVVGLGIYKTVIFAISAATKAWAIVQGIINTVMAINPVTLIIIGIAALIAAIVLLVMNWGTVVKFMTGVWSGFVGWITGVMNGFAGWWGGVWDGLVGFLSGIWNGVINFLAGIWNNIVNGAIAAVTWYLKTISTGFTAVWTFIGDVFNNILNFFGTVWTNIVNGVVGFVQWYLHTIISGFTAVWTFIGDVLNNIVKFFADTWNNVVNGVSGMIGNVGKFFSGLWGTITGALAGAGQWLWDAGVNIVQGLFNGISSLAGSIGNFFLNLLPGWIVAPFKAALGIQSPSRLFKAFGGFIGEGLVIGLEGSSSSIRATSSKMAKEVINAFDHHAITRGMENRLLASISSANNTLERLASSRASVLGRLKNATTAYVDVLKIKNDYAASITSSDMGGVDASKTLDLVGDLSEQISKTKELTTTLAQLKKMGLDSTTYKQLADGGLSSIPAAEELLSTGKSGISRVVALQKQLGTAAKGLGATAADNLYGAGVQSAAGLVNGLKSQSGAISRQMTIIAESMSSAIKKALGIRSPSTVFHGFGENIVEGLMRGVNKRAPEVPVLMENLVKVPAVPHAAISGAGVARYGATGAGITYKTTINQVDNPIGTAHAVQRRLTSLTV